MRSCCTCNFSQNKLNQTDPDTRRHMDVIGDEIHRLDRVVQTLVDFTRPRELPRTGSGHAQVLDDVAILAAPDAEQHGVRVVREFPSQPLLVRVDVDLMKQAILNLVINGVQAMTKGGALTLAAQRKDDAVVAEIRDQGAGIPPETPGKSFRALLHNEKRGTGIGLAQTSQILDWHYGSVDFESTVGVGTTFRLRVPAASQNRCRSAKGSSCALLIVLVRFLCTRSGI